MTAGAKHGCACLRAQPSGSRSRDLEARLGYLARSCLKTEKKKKKKKEKRATRQTNSSAESPAGTLLWGHSVKGAPVNAVFGHHLVCLTIS